MIRGCSPALNLNLKHTALCEHLLLGFSICLHIFVIRYVFFMFFVQYITACVYSVLPCCKTNFPCGNTKMEVEHETK